MSRKENIGVLTDLVLEGMKTCFANKEVWKTDKPKMMRIMEEKVPRLYNDFPRICTTLVQGHDIQPLLGMIKTFHQVQAGEMTLDSANDLITGHLNEKYVNGVLYSDKLVKEREEKMKQMKISEIE